MTVSLQHEDSHWNVVRGGAVLGRFRKMTDAIEFMELVLYQAA